MPTYGVNPVESTVPPWAVQQRIGTTAARYALNSMLMPRTDSGLTYTDYRSGVMASGDGDNTHLAMQVTAATGMDVTVAQGNAVVNTQNQGAYMCCLDSTKTVTLPASSGTTNRYDLIVGRVYDDNNTALSGSSNVRQFTVEVVQGDPVTGIPVVPDPPVGGIALASVYVGKGVTNLNGTDPNATAPHNGAVQDLRGPGLVARGGMRALYKADTLESAPAYQQPGAYPGDQRWVHTAGFQHQVYYGASQGWRGVHNAMVYNANPAPGLPLWTKYTTTPVEMCRVHIPYPGTPFMIYPTGRARLTMSKDVKVDLRITLDEANGSAVNWQTANTLGIEDNSHAQYGYWGDTTHTVSVPPIMFGEFDRALDVVLSGWLTGQLFDAYGFAFSGNDTGANLLSVIVYPSTVQPPEW